MSSEIIKPEPIPNTERGLTLRSFDDVWKFATAVVRSGMVEKTFKTVEQVVIALQTGLEIGLPPMQALQSIAVINGRATIWGDALPGLVWASGLCEGIEETIDGDGDNRTATCRVTRKGVAAPMVATFSMGEAKRAGLTGKGPWSQYPDRMLKTRARAFALRDGFADVLRGLQCREEVIDYTPAESGPATEKRIARIPKEMPVESSEIIEAATSQAEPISETVVGFTRRIERIGSELERAQLAMEIGESLADGGLTQAEADELTAKLKHEPRN